MNNTLATNYNTQVINIETLRCLDIQDIDNYGTDIQQVMTDASSNILDRAHMIDLGSTKHDLDELYDISKKHKKLDVPIIGKPLRRIRSLTSNYSKVQSRLDDITVAIDQHKQRIDTHVVYMQEQITNLQEVLIRLRTCENELTVYSEELQAENSEDQIRVQAVAQRLRNINGTRIIAEQAQAEALMILAEQREARSQLEEVIKNAIPAIKVQAINSIGIRVNKETQEIINMTREVTGNIIVQNATEVKNMAEALSKNRTKSIVDDDKLLKAQNILTETLKIVNEASKIEVDSNLKAIANLQEKASINKDSIEALQRKIGMNS